MTAEMGGLLVRLAAGLGLLTAAVAVVVGPATGPAYGAPAPCVAVVVDARLAGGSVQTGCARRDPDSGLEALTAAGFSYAFVPRQPGQVCQIDRRPACSATSADTYWSYWHRAAGSSRWVYSGEGAATYDPEPGTTEAWVWQDGGRRKPPGVAFGAVCPTRDREPSDPPASAKAGGGRTAEPHDPPATGKPRPVPTRRGSTASPTGPDASASSPAVTTPSATTTTSPTPSDAGPATAASSGSVGTEQGSSSPQRDDGGGPWAGFAIGAGLVAILAGAIWLRHRRTPGSGP